MHKTIILLLILGSFGCKPRAEHAASSLEGSVVLRQDVPPLVSYHFGQYRYLRSYGDRDGALSEQEWISIPSNKNYSGFRRGFYVSQHPAYNERYALEYLGASRDLAPWLAEVHVKPECLKSGRFALDLRQITGDPKFQKWINGVGGGWNLDVFQRSCQLGVFMNQEKESNCTLTLNAYYRTQNIGIVYDHFWPGSGFWLIRDNECIEKILASPKSVLDVFSRVPELWRTAPYDTNAPRDTKDLGRATHGLFHVLVRALHETTDPDQAVLARIEQAANDSDYPVTSDAVAQVAKVARYCAQRGEYESFRQQTEFFLSKAEQRGYLDVDKQAANSQSISYDAHIQRFVSVGLPRACTGAREVVAGVVAVPGGIPPKALGAAPESPVPQPGAAAPAAVPAGPAFVCKIDANTCAPGQKAFVKALATSGLTLDELNILRVYVDYSAGGHLDAFKQHVSIAYDGSAGAIGAMLKQRKAVVAAAREFQKNYSDMQITCALGSDQCLVTANMIRTTLNANTKYSAKSLRIAALDIDYSSGYFGANHVDVAYDASAGALVKLLEARLDYLASIDQVTASLAGAKVSCVVGQTDTCNQAMIQLGHALTAKPEYTAKAIRATAVTIGYSSTYLAPDRVDLAYDARANAMNANFAKRLAFLADMDAHKRIFPNAKLTCELGGDTCPASAATVYKAATAGTTHGEKDLNVKRLVISYSADYYPDDTLVIPYDTNPKALIALYDKRATYVINRDKFKKDFAGVRVSCVVADACERQKEVLFKVTADNGMTGDLLKVSRIVFDYSTEVGDVLKIAYDSNAGAILKALRQQQNKK